MAPILHIQLLGEFRLLYDGAPVLTVDTPRLQSLLAFLLLHHAAVHPRAYIAYALWPDSTDKQALTNLRHLLHDLRQALPHANRYIRADAKTLSWDVNSRYYVDIDEFQKALSSTEDARQAQSSSVCSALKAAVDLYKGDLLPSCYDEWIEPERERLRQEYGRALTQLVRLLEDRREYEDAIHYARRLKRHEPLREPTYRTLMRLHALLDDRASALKVYHDCTNILEEEFGTRPGRGTRELYERLTEERVIPDAAEGRHSRDLVAKLPLVGRQIEWGQLKGVWKRAASGNAGITVITGEAGIGKTRLAEELIVWCQRQGIATARARSYAAEGRLAYAPIADWLRSSAIRSNLSYLDTCWISELARILPELQNDYPDLPATRALHEEAHRHRLFEGLSRAVLAGEMPLLLFLDDMQWTDRATFEWLRYLLRFAPEAPLLILGTIRKGELEPGDDLYTLLLDLHQDNRVLEIPLDPLSASETAMMSVHITGRTLEDVQANWLYAETEGNPLFVVERIRAGLPETDAGDFHGSAATEASRDPYDVLPSRIHAVLTSRLLQLSSSACKVADAAAVIGRDFTIDLLAACCESTEDELESELAELWQRRIIQEEGNGRFDFTHDKLRKVAYENLHPARRRILHRKCARALEAIHAGSLGEASVQIARHYDMAALPAKAIHYYQKAAYEARLMYANEEALAYLSRARDLLKERPESESRQEERSLLIEMGLSLIPAKGYAASEVGRAYSRAYELCDQSRDPQQLASVLWGLWSFHVVRAELERAHELAEQFVQLTEDRPDPAVFVASHFCLGSTLFHLGALVKAREHLEAALSYYATGQHDAHVTFFGPDTGVFCLGYLSHTLWHLGFPDQALDCGQRSLRHARDLADDFSLAIALDYTGMLHHFRGEYDEAAICAEDAVALCGRLGFSYYHAWGTIMHGSMRVFTGAMPYGVQQVQEGLNALEGTGAMLRRPYYAGLLAEVYGKSGDTENGLLMLDEALSLAEESKEWWYAAELYRIRGELLQRHGSEDDRVEDLFRQAVTMAQRQGARSLELRAVMSLSSLLEDNGRQREAARMLHSVLDGFTEGYRTKDHLKARELLGARADYI